LLAQPPSERTQKEASSERAQVPGPASRSGGDAPTTKSGDAGANTDTTAASYEGVRACNLCHGRGTQEQDQRFDYLVKLNEIHTWSSPKDKHSSAADALDPARVPLAAHMKEVLGEKEYTGLLSQCRKCHDTGEPASSTMHGVTCEACHGPASNWIDPHWKEPEKYRYKSLADKTKDGMIDVRDPVTKATLCSSCHLGDASAGKVVTHEMYAAGHPPLAGFEAATYAVAMPAHWTPMSAKPEKYQRHHGQFHQRAPETRQMLLGGLSSLSSYLTLLADYAKLPANASTWPELALYDCFACHHDLQRESWRQSRGYGKHTPGRPPLRAWPNVLARLALQQAGTEAAVREKLDHAARTVGRRPFGEPAEIIAAASAAADEIDNAAKALKAQLDRSGASAEEAQAQDRKLTEQVLRNICELASSEYQDYDSARQLVWAIDVVYKEHVALNSNSEVDGIRTIVDELKTLLGAGVGTREQAVAVPITPDDSSKARANYKAMDFKSKFQELLARLSSK
jgi:hypothetical protein